MNGCPCKEENSVIQGEKPQDGGDSDWKIHLVALKDQFNSGPRFTFPICVLSSKIKKEETTNENMWCYKSSDCC